MLFATKKYGVLILLLSLLVGCPFEDKKSAPPLPTPADPGNVTVTAKQGEIIVRWETAEHATSYTVNIADRATFPDLEVTPHNVGDVNQTTITNLLPGRQYIVTVQANNKDSFSPGENAVTTYQPSNWKAAVPSTPAVEIHDMSWNGSTYVAVGNGGTIITSTDGNNWSMQNSGMDGWIHAIEWMGDKFVAIEASGTEVSTSLDGIEWTQHQLQSTFFYTVDTAWNGETLVAASDDGEIRTSLDGIHWQEPMRITERGFSFGIKKIDWFGTQFIAVGRGGFIASSPDGETWTSHNTNTDCTSFDIAWSGTLYVTACAHSILTSNDGATWDIQPSPNDIFASAITWKNEQFILVSGGETFVSDDGRSWQQQPGNNIGRGLTKLSDVGNKLFVHYWSGGIAATSDDGFTWYPHPLLTSDNFGSQAFNGFSQIIWKNDEFFALGSGITATSPDGVLWVINKETNLSTYSINDLDWNGSLYVVSESDFGIFTSIDGITWEFNQDTRFFSPESTIWGNNLFIATSRYYGSGHLTSLDGINWESHTSTGLKSMTWNGSMYLSIDDSGNSMGSIDGISWELLAEDIFPWNHYSSSDIIWHNNYFYIANGRNISKSPDGISWTELPLNVYDSNFTSTLDSHGNVLYAIDSDWIHKTNDAGQTWDSEHIPYAGIQDFACSPDRCVAVGRSGIFIHQP